MKRESVLVEEAVWQLILVEDMNSYLGPEVVEVGGCAP